MTMSMTGATGMKTGALPGDKVPKGMTRGQLQQYNPDQMQLFQNNMELVGPNSQLRGMAQGDDAAFAPFEQYGQRQFQEFTGQNASRFSGLGMGSRHGSDFHNMQTQGAQDFATQLAMQRQGLQRQALMDLQGMSQQLLGERPYDRFFQKRNMPFWKELTVGGVNHFAEGAGQAAGAAMMG